MAVLLLGLLLFFGIHVFVAIRPWRDPVADRLGERPWKGLVALLSFAGIGLIVWGWHLAPRDPVFAPSMLARQIAPITVSVAIVLFAAANTRAWIRHALRHPMLLGILLWSGTHLLADGSVRATWLFGAFFAYAVFDLIAVLIRGVKAQFTPSWSGDVVSVLIGLIVADAIIWGHGWLFGVAVLG
jgi:uncharacterized membrane protein